MGEKLGEGMVGIIYKAKWRGSVVAAKCLREGYQQNTVEWEDLIEEITILVPPRRSRVPLWSAPLEPLPSLH